MAARSKRSSKQRQRQRGYAARGRQIPWLWLAVGAVALIGGFFLVRSLEIGAPGERVAVSGVGVHPPEGQPISYNSVPPVGGPHWQGAAPWGFSGEPVPDERAVHNLEHGGVVISHNGISADDLTKLRSLIQVYPRDRFNQVKVLIRPYNGIASGTFVLAAWGWKQSFTAYDEAAVRAFLDAHLGRCCENVP